MAPNLARHPRSPWMTAPAADPLDERALVARAQKGDVDAFERLYRANVGRVYAICLRMSGDQVRARELVQDVFVRAWERLGSYRGDAALATWLHRLAVNVVLTALRTDRRRSARVSLGDDASDGDGGSGRSTWQDGSPSARAAAAGGGAASGEAIEARIDLERAISSLPKGARTVFVLHDIEGFQHAEIAKMTGSAEGTLRAQLHRARQLLMQRLGG